MDGKQRERAAKLDRRAVARLHAEIIDCADDPHKMSHHSMIDDLREFGVEVTFKQIENALRTLGYKWKEVFLPASNSDRGKKPRQPEADRFPMMQDTTRFEMTQDANTGPDIWAVLNRIEQLEQTLTTSGMAECRALCDRIRSLDERATVIHTDVKRAVVESRNLHQQAKQEAQLAKERAAAMRTDMSTLLNRVDELSIQQQALLRLVSSIRLHQDRQQSEQTQPTQEPQP